MTDYTETLPQGSKPIPTVPDDSEDNFTANRERLEKEHIFPGNADPNRGRHSFGSGDDAARDAAIVTPAAGMIWVRDDMPGIVEFHDGTDWRPHGVAYGTAADRILVTTAEDGAHWRDSDTEQLWWWDGVAWSKANSQRFDEVLVETSVATTVNVGAHTYVEETGGNDIEVDIVAPAANANLFKYVVEFSMPVDYSGGGPDGIQAGPTMIEDPSGAATETRKYRAQPQTGGSASGAFATHISCRAEFSGLSDGETYRFKLSTWGTGGANSIGFFSAADSGAGGETIEDLKGQFRVWREAI